MEPPESHRSAPVDGLERARRLRREMTGPERALWRALRESDLKFRRQVPFGPYIVDFYDAARGLVVELDGDSHIGRADPDRVRQAWLESRNLRVLRVSNDEVIADVAAVVEAIVAYRGEPNGRTIG